MLKGIYPPLTTPFIRNEVAYKKLEENVKKYNTKGLSGYVVLGSNGESVFLTKDEKLKLISIVREHTSNKKLIIAGTGLESIKETISLSNEAAENGADYALIITPSFFKSFMNHKAFIEYYTSVADSISIPVIVYNVTKFTNVDIQLETIVKISEHPNIAGIKNSTENIAQISATIYNTKDDFMTLVGTGSVLLPGLISGAVGGIVALANVAPQECVTIFRFFNEGKIEDARAIQDKMLLVNNAITAKYGVAGLKAAMGILGYYGGLPRKPLQPLTSANFKNIKSILFNAGLLK
jgi:4-hydroxy-2-oxoglutarate aldolase